MNKVKQMVYILIKVANILNNKITQSNRSKHNILHNEEHRIQSINNSWYDRIFLPSSSTFGSIKFVCIPLVSAHGVSLTS